MEPKTVNTELWEVKYSILNDNYYININDDYVSSLKEGTLNLIVTAVNACKSINPDNPLNVAKAICEMYESLQKCRLKLVNSNLPKSAEVLKELIKKITE